MSRGLRKTGILGNLEVQPSKNPLPGPKKNPFLAQADEKTRFPEKKPWNRSKKPRFPVLDVRFRGSQKIENSMKFQEMCLRKKNGMGKSFLEGTDFLGYLNLLNLGWAKNSFFNGMNLESSIFLDRGNRKGTLKATNRYNQ